MLIGATGALTDVQREIVLKRMVEKTARKDQSVQCFESEQTNSYAADETELRRSG